MGVNESFGTQDLEVDDLIVIIRNIGTMHDVTPYTAWLYVNILNRDRKASRPPPMRQMFGIRPSFEHELAPRIKDTGYCEFPIFYGRDGVV